MTKYQNGKTDEVDSSTIDFVDIIGSLHDEAPKRSRGRPKVPGSLSNADRQKAYRERLRASGEEVLTVTLDSEVAKALRDFVRLKDETQGHAISRILRDRLLRKR